MNPSPIKAIGLFSGGLDSMLAIKVIESQGVEVQAMTFVSPFFGDREKLQKAAQKNAINLKIIDVSRPYLKMVKSPKYGYGKAMNPCIDCKIFMLREAEKYARENGAHFIFTGEVLGQRPMSQNSQSLQTILRDSGLEKRLVRPLSGKLLPPTEAEEKGWLDREKLLDIQGRGRSAQLDLARHYDLQDYGSPAGGCLLTEKQYGERFKDLLALKKRTTVDDVKLLRAGRYFRFAKNMIIVGRNQEDNEKILDLQKKYDWLFKAKDIPGPTTLLRGEKSRRAVYTAAALTAYYSDSKTGDVPLVYGENFENSMTVPKPDPEQFEEIKKNIAL